MPGVSAESFDYIVVGSGAGGGPLAANLALAGFRVLVLEAGGESTGPMYDIPVFHGFAAEDPEMAWSFFVRHYQSTEQQKRDSKFTAAHDGVLYPRAGTLGGCTAHNAMITILPHPSDWDGIAELTGDESWYSRRMHHYFQRLENCAYVDSLTNFAVVVAWRKLQRLVYRALGQPELANPGKHGLHGWLHTQMPDVGIGMSDHELMIVSVLAVKQAASRGLEANAWFGRAVATFDPNDAERDARTLEGFVFTPLATRNGRRNGARERILEVRAKHPDRLVVRMNALVTRVLFDADRRATGVEYLEGARLYRADLGSTNAEAPRRTVQATREVILSAGAFNTPQLLKLSGVGPAEELRRHNIPVVVDLPGVGENLQDRYEVGVISEMATNFSALESASFVPPESYEAPEPAVKDWQMGAGIYTSNGAIGGIMLKSSPEKPVPDLFVFGLPGHFKGYFPGYSKELLTNRNVFTWAILKAHTDNRAGQVLLRSADPRDTPDIQFHYFGEGSDKEGDDLRAVVEGVKFARGIMARAGNHVRRELLPGPALQSDEQIGEFVRNEAWGHHASCSAPIGADGDPRAVLDSRFRVRGVKGLRVVDASAFPRIPGFFIVTAVYMISEKASDVIIEDAGGARPAA